jgi:hypothetical protein
MIRCEECAILFNAFELLSAGTGEKSVSESLDKCSSNDTIPIASELLHNVSDEETIPETSEALPTSYNQGFVPDASELLRTDATADFVHSEDNTQDTISEEENTAVTTPDEDDEFSLFEKPEKKEKEKEKGIWGLAFNSCLVLLAFQIYFFSGYGLTQNTTFRPWLEKTCKLINCQLPIYKNLDEFTILHGSFEPATNNKHYIFKAVFVNQSDFKQNHPSIKLTLQSFTGQIIAERIFRPEDYLKKTQLFIEPEMSSEIRMKIVAPAKTIGGYSFELV